jgi:Histidine phosphatase superfamily (branch 1)
MAPDPKIRETTAHMRASPLMACRNSVVARLLALSLLAMSGCVASVPRRTTVILVRHAEREALSTPDPELSAAGRLRAQDLVLAASGAGIQAIIITQFVRTGATAKPLAVASESHPRSSLTPVLSTRRTSRTSF